MMMLAMLMINMTALQDEPVAAISVSDSFGNTVDSEVTVGTLLIVSGRDAQHARVEGSLSWYVEPAVPSYVDSSGDTLVISSGLQPTTIHITQIVSSLSGKHDFTRLAIRVGQAPNPPPIDPDDDDPAPVPPTPTEIKVLIIEETANRTVATANIITSPKIRQWVLNNCSKTDRIPDYRVYDQDTAVENQPQWIRDGFDEPRSSLPWLIIHGRHSGPLPDTVEETLEILNDARTNNQRRQLPATSYLRG